MNATQLARIPRGPPGPGSDDASVATTALASEVGSVVGRPKDAYLRSITFLKPGLLKPPDMDASNKKNKQHTRTHSRSSSQGSASSFTKLTPTKQSSSVSSRNGNSNHSFTQDSLAVAIVEEEEEEENNNDNNDQAPATENGGTGTAKGPVGDTPVVVTMTDQAPTSAPAASDNHEWTLDLVDAPPTTKKRLMKLRRSNSNGGANAGASPVLVDSVGGIIRQYSLIQPGDSMRLVNGTTIGPSFNAVRTTELLHTCYQRDSYLHVQVLNPSGQDSLVQATVVKPKADMTYKDLGMVVWYWGVLCIKEIADDSIWSKTVLKENDHILSVNDILCDKMKEASFAHIISELPQEITILVRRGKQRWLGGFN